MNNSCQVGMISFHWKRRLLGMKNKITTKKHFCNIMCQYWNYTVAADVQSKREFTDWNQINV